MSPGAKKPVHSRLLKEAEELSQSETVDVKVEVKSREHPEDAAWRRQKDRWVTWLVIGMIAVSALVSFWIVLRPGYPADVRTWAIATLSSSISLGVGFLGGKSAR